MSDDKGCPYCGGSHLGTCVIGGRSVSVPAEEVRVCPDCGADVDGDGVCLACDVAHQRGMEEFAKIALAGLLAKVQDKYEPKTLAWQAVAIARAVMDELDR